MGDISNQRIHLSKTQIFSSWGPIFASVDIKTTYLWVEAEFFLSSASMNIYYQQVHLSKSQTFYAEAKLWVLLLYCSEDIYSIENELSKFVIFLFLTGKHWLFSTTLNFFPCCLACMTVKISETLVIIKAFFQLRPKDSAQANTARSSHLFLSFWRPNFSSSASMNIYNHNQIADFLAETFGYLLQ